MSRTFKEKLAYGNAVRFILNRVGAVFTHTDDMYCYTVATQAGPLRISLGDDCCVCTRFENIDDALDLGLGERLNVHSGKWNWMGGNNHQEDMVDLANFHAALRKIL
jgi:hypothetical protein